MLRNPVSVSNLKKQLLTFILIMGFAAVSFKSYGQSVSVNTTGAKPNPSAGLDVDFPDKGMLIPRVVLLSTVSPAPLAAHLAGMVVYNTSTQGDVVPGLYINDGTRWLTYTPPAATAPGTMFFWNGTAWVLIPPGTPGQKLQLNSSGIPVWK